MLTGRKKYMNVCGGGECKNAVHLNLQQLVHGFTTVFELLRGSIYLFFQITMYEDKMSVICM